MTVWAGRNTSFRPAKSVSKNKCSLKRPVERPRRFGGSKGKGFDAHIDKSLIIAQISKSVTHTQHNFEISFVRQKDCGRSIPIF